MKSLLVIAAVCFLTDEHCGAADSQPSDVAATVSDVTPLLADGALQKVREPLSQIFQFKSDSGKLQLDRSAWESIVKQIEEKNAVDSDPANLPLDMKAGTPEALRYQARKLEEKARQLERQQHMGSLPPLFTLFQSIEKESHRGSRHFSGGGPGYSSNGKWKEWNSSFRGEFLSGTFNSNNDSERVSFEELSSPKRTLEFVTAVQSDEFRLLISDPEGNLLLFRQLPDGGSSIVNVLSGKVLCYEGNSFGDVFQRNRAAIQTNVLPVFEQFGIRFPLP